MALSTSHELAELVADLARVVDALEPPHEPADGGSIGAALHEFEQAWATDRGSAVMVGEFGRRIAAAGMALVEGDAQTVRRLVTNGSSRLGAP